MPKIELVDNDSEAPVVLLHDTSKLTLASADAANDLMFQKPKKKKNFRIIHHPPSMQASVLKNKMRSHYPQSDMFDSESRSVRASLRGSKNFHRSKIKENKEL